MAHLRFLLALGFALSLAACSNTSSSELAPTTYRDSGPWEAGVTTLELADRQVEVWYPVNPGDTAGLEPAPYYIRDELSDTLEEQLPDDVNPPFITDAFRGAPASADGPFPLVLFAHGSASYRNQSAFLTAHLASWGFVVASADYLERGLKFILSFEPKPDMDDTEISRMVVTLLASENDREGSLLQDVVSTDQIAITGHSAGGGTSIQFGGEPDVITYIPLSAGVSSDGMTVLPDKPSLWLTGKIDDIVVPQRTIDAFNASSAPTRLVLIDDMGHLGPSDICTIGESGGGVIALAKEAGLPVEELGLERLGTDGCQEEALPIEDGWPVIRHFVTAQLRWAFGFDEEAVGMTQDVQELFPEASFDYDESL
jgi:dienelactone hydrolase